MLKSSDFVVHLPSPHPRQRAFIDSSAKRKVIRAGRRSGKTVGISILAVQRFLAGKRVLYGAPTTEQVERFWVTVSAALAEPIAGKLFYKNETEHVIELPGTERRIRAKTCWNSDTLRGDYADLLLLDEWQLMDEDAWGVVGAPMLLDNNGDAVFVYTPPSLHSRSVSKASDPRHAAKLFQRAQQDTTGRWATFHFTSRDNPHISAEAIGELAADMTERSYRQEIMAEDIEDAEGALWKREQIEASRVVVMPELQRVVVGVDPAITSGATSNETGIIVGAIGADGEGYVLNDASLVASPDGWARAAVAAYSRHQADRLVAEVNQGGEMVGATLHTVAPNVAYKAVHASRGKAIRAEPIAALYEQGRIHHVGTFPELEDQLCQWVPGNDSPDRLDALVWAFTELMLEPPAMQPGRVVYTERANISPF